MQFPELRSWRFLVTSVKVVYEACVIRVDVQALFLSVAFGFGAIAASSSRACGYGVM